MKYPVIANSDGRDNVFIASVLDALKVFLKKNGTIEYIETIYFSLTKTRLEKLPRSETEQTFSEGQGRVAEIRPRGRLFKRRLA